MSLPSGLAGQFGMIAEDTYGVQKTATRFWPLVSESLDLTQARIESAAVRAGYRFIEHNDWTPGSIAVGGDIGMELTDRGCGLLFSSIFGSVNTSGSGTYTHTFTPSSSTLASYCLSLGRPLSTGTVVPVHVTGAKVQSASIAGKEDEAITLGMTWIGKDMLVGTRQVTDGVTTNTSTSVTSSTAAFTQADVGKLITGTGISTGTTIASVTSSTAATLSAAATATGTSITFTIGKVLPSASYASSANLMTYGNGVLTVGSLSLGVTEWEIKIENGLVDRRPRAGSLYTAEPLFADNSMATATIKAEFDTEAAYTQFRAGTEGALSLAITHPVSTYSATISGNVRFDKATTNVNGKGLLEVDIEAKFVRTAAGADSTAIQAVLVNGDSAP